MNTSPNNNHYKPTEDDCELCGFIKPNLEMVKNTRTEFHVNCQDLRMAALVEHTSTIRPPANRNRDDPIMNPGP